MFGLKYFMSNNPKHTVEKQFTPPDTWKSYLAKGDYSGIITMKFNEFITAERGNDIKNKRRKKHAI